MPSKRVPSENELFEWRQMLQIATLDALLASRRWAPGDLIFQGGTSLHLVYGSPRFSEDLDFLVNESIDLQSISESVRLRLQDLRFAGGALRTAGKSVRVSKSKDRRNPHSFVVSLSEERTLGAARVKVEMWKAPGAALSTLQVLVRPVRLPSGVASFVPSASVSEIRADKVFALGARPYLKPRDIFDLYWLSGQEEARECTEQDFRTRFAIYPNLPPRAWLEQSSVRRREIIESSSSIADDLRRFLPFGWPMGESEATLMVERAVRDLDRARRFVRHLCKGNPSEEGQDCGPDRASRP